MRFYLSPAGDASLPVEVLQHLGLSTDQRPKVVLAKADEEKGHGKALILMNANDCHYWDEDTYISYVFWPGCVNVPIELRKFLEVEAGDVALIASRASNAEVIVKVAPPLPPLEEVSS